MTYDILSFMIIMQFGVQIEPQFGFDFDETLEISKIAVKNGFSTLWFSDHFMLDKSATDRILLDPWLLMTALVQQNKDIRVGSLVFCNSYRNPALTAKMAATLDVISGGRFEFGYGAGWKELEYEAYGYRFPSDYERIEQLSEAVQIIRGIWTHEKFSFSGQYYSVKEIVSCPKPTQEHPNIWIGTMKAKNRMLELIAKYGDGLNVAWAFTRSECQKIFRTLDDLGEKHGRERGSLLKSVGFWTRCFEDEEEMLSAIIENAARRSIDIDEYKKRIDSSLWGTPEMLIERLNDFRDLGLSHAIFMFPHQIEKEQIDLFGSKVLKHL